MTQTNQPKPQNKRFVLTRENYYSVEADRKLMSVSSFKNFLKCEASELARIKGEYVRPSNTAFLEGNFLHSWAESPEAHSKFIEENKDDLFKTKGSGMYANFQKIEDNVIPRLEADKDFMKVLQGEKEKILRAKYLGVEWKARMDVYNPQKGYFVDLKFINNPFNKHFNVEKEVYQNFVEFYGYDFQMVTYAQIEKAKTKRKEPLKPYILVVSKDDIPYTMLIGDLLDYQDDIIEDTKPKLERVLAVKEGIVEPRRCGRCEYCKSSGKLEAYSYKFIPID